MKAGPRLIDAVDLHLEIIDAAGLLADTDFERFLRRQRFGAWLGEVVGKADNLTFGGLCNRVGCLSRVCTANHRPNFFASARLRFIKWC